MEELALLHRQISGRFSRLAAILAISAGGRVDDHSHALHGLPPCPRLAYDPAARGAFGTSVVRFRSTFFSDDLSVYRQTDDWPRVKCEVFLFRLRFCVYAE
jgi:hypothetical protein